MSRTDKDRLEDILEASHSRDDHFQNTQLVWIDDSRTLIPIDQPKILIDHLHTFLAAQT